VIELRESRAAPAAVGHGHCLQAGINDALFHGVPKYGREVIDLVRVDEANRLRQDRAACKVAKGARWLLLRNGANLAGAQNQVRFNELPAANRALFTV